MPVTTLNCEDCDAPVAWADGEGVFWEGTKADCAKCGARWRVDADGERAWLVSMDEN